MNFYLEKVDENQSFLIVRKLSEFEAGIVGWRVEAISAPGLRKEPLLVFPVLPNDESEVIAVLKLKLDQVERIQLTPIAPGSDGSRLRSYVVDLDENQVSLARAGRHDADIWHISVGRIPRLEVESLHSVQEELIESREDCHTYVVRRVGTRITPGCALHETGNPAVVRLTSRIVERTDEISYEGDIILSIQKEPEEHGRALTIRSEHFLATADVSPILDGTESIGLQQNFEKVEIGATNVDTHEITLRRHSDSTDSIGLDFLDRVAIEADHDCVFEYWNHDVQKFSASNGLVVLTYLGDGEFVEDTGDIRDILWEQILKNDDHREPSLLDIVESVGLVMPFSSSERFVMPLQFACYELSKFMSENLPNMVELIPYSMDAFVRRPEIYFAVKHPEMAEVAVYLNDVMTNSVPLRSAIKEVSQGVLDKQLAAKGHFPNQAELSNWCDVPDSCSWYLYEALLSGQASKMYLYGVSFDTQNPQRFLKEFSSHAATLETHLKGQEARTPLLESHLESKHVPLHEVLSNIDILEREWRAIEGIRESVAMRSNLYVSPPKTHSMERAELLGESFDTSYRHRQFRDHISRKTELTINDWLKAKTGDQRLSHKAVHDILNSWFMADHLSDCVAIENFLKTRLADITIEKLLTWHFAENVDTPEANLQDITDNAFDATARNCKTRFCQEFVEKLRKLASVD